MNAQQSAIGAVLLALTLGGCGGGGAGAGGSGGSAAGGGGAGDSQDRPLAAAIRRGDADEVAALLAKGIDPYNGDADGMPPLILAVKSGNLRILELLLKHRAEPEQRARNSDLTPLMQAVDQGNKEAVRLLLDHRASPSTQAHQGDTPLLRAMRQGNIEIAELLIDRGADVNARHEDVSPLEMAVRGGREDLACRLIEKGAGVNDFSEKDRKSALILAAEHDMLKAAELLLMKRARTDLKDVHGKTALDYAKSEPMKQLLAKSTNGKT